MKLVSPICSNRIAEEVVGDLVGKTWRYCIVIDFIAHEMNCIAVTRKLYFAQNGHIEFEARSCICLMFSAMIFLASLPFFSSLPG